MTSIEEMKQGISHQEGFFDGVRGAQTYYQCWLPDGESKAVLFIVHGLAEHSGRYMHIVNHFVPLGYAVYGHDCFGHGKSEGTRVFVEQFKDYTEPLKTYFDKVCESQPGCPIFLLGHSVGGLIGAKYLLDRQSDFVGAILSGPCIRSPYHPSALVLLALRLIAAVVPKLGIIQLESDVMSTDPKEVEGYVSDPLVHPGKVTAGFLNEMYKAIKRVTRHASQITLPLLIVQGGADATIDPAGAQLLYDTVGSSDKTIKVYEGYYHEIFNEPKARRDKVFQDIQDWLETRL